MSGRILINYRRDDSLGSAGRLYDRLVDHLSREKVFMDVDAIEPGVDFVEVIERAIGNCDVFVAVIGPDWLTITDDEGRRRLENPDDFVRLEIAAALERDIRVIPVLVKEATMPRTVDLPDNLKSLARRNAIEISHTRFDTDADRLIRAIERAIEQVERNKVVTEESYAKKANSNKVIGKEIDENFIESEQVVTDRSVREKVEVAFEDSKIERDVTKTTPTNERLISKDKAPRSHSKWSKSTIVFACIGVVGVSVILFAIIGVVLANITGLFDGTGLSESGPIVTVKPESVIPSSTARVDTSYPLPEFVENFTGGDGYDSINFETNLSLDSVLIFYRHEFEEVGYSEREMITVITDTSFSIVFDGHDSGKAIVVQGVDLGENTNVNIKLENH